MPSTLNDVFFVLQASAVSGSGGLKQAQSQRLESRHEGAVGLSTYLTYLGAFQCAPYVAIMLALFLVRH
jgi:hypothetical protein